MPVPVAPPPTVSSGVSRRRRFLPRQHGAWVMLLLPSLAGVTAAGWRWPDVPLVVAWVTGYPLTYYLFTGLKSRHLRRYRPQIAAYATVCTAALVITIASQPQILRFAPVFVALLAVNAVYARQRRDRALVNDLALVVQSCMIVFITADIAGQPASSVTDVFLVCLMYLAGTVLHVKNMIREHGTPGWSTASIAYHAATAVIGWLISRAAGLVFTGLLTRAVLLPRDQMSPARVGAVEAIASVAVLTTAAAL